jgi:hypothetical protein
MTPFDADAGSQDLEAYLSISKDIEAPMMTLGRCVFQDKPDCKRISAELERVSTPPAGISIPEHFAASLASFEALRFEDPEMGAAALRFVEVVRRATPLVARTKGSARELIEAFKRMAAAKTVHDKVRADAQARMGAAEAALRAACR